MKKLETIFFLVMAIGFVSACSSKKEEAATEEKQEAASDEWKEMDTFHMIMAETYHPYKDSMNLEPLKAQIGDLVSSAAAWVSAPLPEKVNNDEMKVKLEQLKSGCESLAQLVPTGSDEEIGASLTTLHDKFHEIQEGWYGNAGEHKHDH